MVILIILLWPKFGLYREKELGYIRPLITQSVVEFIVRKLDEKYKSLILECDGPYRVLGMWEPKLWGFEYRSLPFNSKTMDQMLEITQTAHALLSLAVTPIRSVMPLRLQEKKPSYLPTIDDIDMAIMANKLSSPFSVTSESTNEVLQKQRESFLTRAQSTPPAPNPSHSPQVIRAEATPMPDPTPAPMPCTPTPTPTKVGNGNRLFGWMHGTHGL